MELWIRSAGVGQRRHRSLRFRTAALLPALAGLIAASALAACGEDPPKAAPEDCQQIEGGAHTLVASNLSWDTDCLQVAVGTTVTFTVDNRDKAVLHNLAIEGPSGRAATKLQAGPVTQTLVYEARTVGRHPFVCDPHAGMMKGDLWVV